MLIQNDNDCLLHVRVVDSLVVDSRTRGSRTVQQRLQGTSRSHHNFRIKRGQRKDIKVFLNSNALGYVCLLCYAKTSSQESVCVGVRTCEYRCLQRPETSDPLELEMHIVESHPTWALGTLGSLQEQYVPSTTEPSLQLHPRISFG